MHCEDNFLFQLGRERTLHRIEHLKCDIERVAFSMRKRMRGYAEMKHDRCWCCRTKYAVKFRLGELATVFCIKIPKTFRIRNIFLSLLFLLLLLLLLLHLLLLRLFFPYYFISYFLLCVRILWEVESSKEKIQEKCLLFCLFKWRWHNGRIPTQYEKFNMKQSKKWKKKQQKTEMLPAIVLIGFSGNEC